MLEIQLYSKQQHISHCCVQPLLPYRCHTNLHYKAAHLCRLEGQGKTATPTYSQDSAPHESLTPNILCCSQAATTSSNASKQTHQPRICGRGTMKPAKMNLYQPHNQGKGLRSHQTNPQVLLSGPPSVKWQQVQRHAANYEQAASSAQKPLGRRRWPAPEGVEAAGQHG